METKNIIIKNYIETLLSQVLTMQATANSLNENNDENIATMKTFNVLIESVRSQTINIQNVVDTYCE